MVTFITRSHGAMTGKMMMALESVVLDEKPDICILDWVTPSASVFPDDTVSRINNILMN